MAQEINGVDRVANIEITYVKSTGNPSISKSC